MKSVHLDEAATCWSFRVLATWQSPDVLLLLSTVYHSSTVQPVLLCVDLGRRWYLLGLLADVEKSSIRAKYGGGSCNGARSLGGKTRGTKHKILLRTACVALGRRVKALTGGTSCRILTGLGLGMSVKCAGSLRDWGKGMGEGGLE